MAESVYRERLRARRAVVRSRESERERVRWKRAYLGDGSGNLLADRDQFYYARVAGSDDMVIEARLPSSTWIIMKEGLSIWLKPVRENGQTFYEIAGEAPGTNWYEPISAPGALPLTDDDAAGLTDNDAAVLLED